MMKRRGNTPSAIGEFGAWLLANISLQDWTYGDCAKAIRLERFTICKHVRHLSKPEFQTVVAYCWVFGLKDDPRTVWKLVERDWG